MAEDVMGKVIKLVFCKSGPAFAEQPSLSQQLELSCELTECLSRAFEIISDLPTEQRMAQLKRLAIKAQANFDECQRRERTK